MPSISAIIVSACLSGGAVAGLFVLADASARTQLQAAVTASHDPSGDTKVAAETARTKARPLDKQRLAATISMIGHAESGRAEADAERTR